MPARRCGSRWTATAAKRTGRSPLPRAVGAALAVCLPHFASAVASRNIDFDFTKDEYTCALPVEAGQNLGESLVWKLALEAAEADMGASVQRARHRASDLRRKVEEPDEDEPQESEGGPEDAAQHKRKREKTIEWNGRADAQVPLLLSMVNGKAVAACRAGGDMEAIVSSAAERLISTNVSDLKPALADAVRDGDGSGTSSQGAPVPESDPSCAAPPGSYCLSSMLADRWASLTPFERCALARTINPCPPGFFCTGGSAQPKVCNRGMTCLLGAKEETWCGAGYYCPITVLKYKCKPGQVCGGLNTLPGMCQQGTYCPDGTSSECPEGTFCPHASTRPTPCPWFATCPARSNMPSVRTFARWSLLVGCALWVVAMKGVPPWVHRQGGWQGALPAVAVVAFLCGAWAIRLDLVARVASRLWAGVDPASLTLAGLVGVGGGSPHTTGLLVLTFMYLFLLHGLFISPRIERPAVRNAVDAAMFLTLCVAFNAYLQDWAAVGFVGSIWVAFRILWMLLTQQGPLAVRVALLGAGFVLLSIGLLHLGYPAMVQVMVILLSLSVMKETILELWPRVHFAMKKRKVQGMESVLSDSSFRPLMNSLVTESLRSENPEAHPATAARIAASARASLAETGALSGPADPHARDAWRAYHRGAVAGAEISDDGTIDISDEGSGPPGVSYELNDVSYCLDNKRKLLHNLSFKVPAGAKVAVMGASGSGKTTLLSVLSGRCGDSRFRGQMLLNGVKVRPWQMAELRPLIGYVPQDDVMHKGLSVRENIMFQADLRMRLEDFSQTSETDSASDQGSKRRDHVDGVISGLGLGHVSSRLVGDGLSGGQRKRVSIGMEVVTQPRILLLDEPSSGLDSSTAHRILETVLRGASTDECTTFATIHQPRWSTLGLFDLLVLLAPGGHLVFAGPVTAMKAYFREVLQVEFLQNENPADTVIDVCTFESARKLAIAGVWKNPPQCLRAVLIPTPQVVNEECRSNWQPDEYGRMLGTLWRSFSAATQRALAGAASEEGRRAEGPAPSARLPQVQAQGREELTLRPMEVEDPAAPRSPGLGPGAAQRLTDADSSLAREAKARALAIQWHQQVWQHLQRVLLCMSRAICPWLVVNQLLLMLATSCLAFALSDNLTGEHIFLPMYLLSMLLCILQSVAAQRLFGGEEQQVAWREGSVCSLSQVLFSFVGKDLASVAEIVLSSMCFSLNYWPLSGSLASGSDQAALAFAVIYCVWGLSHIWAILCHRHVSMLLSILVPFLCFLFSGLQPDVATLAGSLGGNGAIFVLASPVRWMTMTYATWHVLGNGSTYLADMFKEWVEPHFKERMFSLNHVRCPDYSANILERWVNGQGHVCHTGQLFLLGFLFRFLAASCLLLVSSSKASGGQLPLGVLSRTRSNVLRDAIVIFLLFFAVFEIALLGRTY